MASRQQDTTEYRFGPYLFIPQRQLLIKDGVPVRIGGRSFDLLTLLVRRAGENVSKTELLSFCWPNTHVQESNLKVNMAALRRKLDSAGMDTYIATVATFGYRFVAPVSRRQQGAADYLPAVIPWQIPQPTEPIGRGEEILQLAERLARSRCVSIVGPGGMGKTTVALALADHVKERFSDGVAFVDMSTVGDPIYAAAAVAAGVGARQQSDDTLAEIVTILRERDMLLVIDNCEHLLTSVSLIVGRLLDALPSLTILTTSREPLSISREHVHRLATLSVPLPHQSATAAEANEFSAVRLFVTRARGIANYTLSDTDAPLVSAICRRLDGIPLAIELAASKTFAYGVHALHTMIEQKLVLLKNSERAAPSRQQTMLATLDWSYRLLSEDEAALLRLVSVFAGKFRLEDAIAVAELASFDTTRTIDGMDRLTSKSLIHTEHHGGFLIYRLLESTRAFASERLVDSGQHPAARLRYVHRVLALFERASTESDTRDKADWMSEFSPRVDDARAVMNWAFSPDGDALLGARLTAAVMPLWYELSALTEMRSRVETALVVCRRMPDRPLELTMKLVGALASTSTFVQQLPENTEAAWRECYELGLQTKSTKYEIMGLWGLSAFLIYTGRTMEAFTLLEKLVSHVHAQSDPQAVDEAERMLATAEIYLGRIVDAKSRLERQVAQHRNAGDPTRLARFHSEGGVGVRCTLALALFVSGEPQRAMHLVRAAIERAKSSGHLVSLGNALAVFAIPLSFWSRDYEAAEEFLHAAEERGRMENTGAWREVCHFFRAALGAKRGVEGAIEELQATLRRMMNAKQVLRAPIYHAMVAEALLDADRNEESLAWANDALQLAVAQNANWCVPEILRVKALIELGSQNLAAAERTFRAAIRKAVDMRALTFELRASVAFARHLVAIDHLDRAHWYLRSSTDKFPLSESFADLIQARQLLSRIEAETAARIAS